MLMEMGSIREVFDLARNAAVAVVGIGSIRTAGSSYFDLHPDPDSPSSIAARWRGDGEVPGPSDPAGWIGRGLPAQFPPCRAEPWRADTVPAPTIGVASGEEKVEPICAALAGRLFNSLIIDEQTATAVPGDTSRGRHVAIEIDNRPIGGPVSSFVVGLGTGPSAGWCGAVAEEKQSIAPLQGSIDAGISTLI